MALLALLTLNSSHRAALQQRGLGDVAIDRSGYMSLPLRGRAAIARQLVYKFGHIATQVPGVVQRQGDHGLYWSLPGAPGLLIPARDVTGAIAGISIRRDDPGDGSRYTWLSSKPHGGPGPQMAAHVPLFGGDARIVRVTEGPLKADVATALSGEITLGLPGCAQWQLALPVLAQIKPSLVLIALDADWRTNPHVAQSLSALATNLHEEGFNVQIEDWRQELGKGIDDLLRNGGIPKRKPWIHALVCKHRGAAPKNREGIAHAS